MEIKYCWRCKMEIPMLDEKEYAIALRLYGAGFGKKYSSYPL